MLGKHLPLRPPRVKGDPRPPKEPRPPREAKGKPPRAAPSGGGMSAVGFALALTALAVGAGMGEIMMPKRDAALLTSLVVAAWALGGIFSLIGFLTGCRRGARGFGLGLCGVIITIISFAAV